MFNVCELFSLDDLVLELRNERNFTNIIQSFVGIEFNLSKGEFIIDEFALNIFINYLAILLVYTPDSKNLGRHYILPENTSIDNCTIFYIGGESLTLTNILMTYNKCKVSNQERFIDRQDIN